MLFYSLKIEKHIDWGWNEVFWAFWLLICILIGISLIIFILVGVKLYEYFKGTSEVMEVQGLFWIFSMIGLISANLFCAFLFFIDILNKIDECEITAGKNNFQIEFDQQQLVNSRQQMMKIIYMIMGAFTFQMIFYIYFRNSINQFVKYFMFEFEEEIPQISDSRHTSNSRQDFQEPREIVPEDQNIANQNQPEQKTRVAYKSRVVAEEKEISQAMNLPQFVSKVSSTYFKFLMNKKEVQKEIIHKNISHQKVKLSQQQFPLESEIELQDGQQEQQQLKQQQQQEKSLSKISLPKILPPKQTKAINKSSNATATITTQGNVNTLAEMIQTSRMNTQEKQFGEITEVEDSNKEGDKKDQRAEMNKKKNIIAHNKQWAHNNEGGALIHEIHSPTNEQTQKKYIQQNEPPQQNHNDKVPELQCVPNLKGVEQGFAQNKRLSTQPTGPKISKNNGNNQHLNQTAPFLAIGDFEGAQEKIYEVDEEQNASIIFKKQNIFKDNNPFQLPINVQVEDFEVASQFNQSLASSLHTSLVNCLVCFDKLPDSIFNPCGHGGLCYGCAVDLMKKTGECLLCRIVRIFDVHWLMSTNCNFFYQKIEEVLKIDLESKSQGIMKILSSTKLVKVREKIQITEQQYQYYSALKRSRLNNVQSMASPNRRSLTINTQNNRDIPPLIPIANNQQENEIPNQILSSPMQRQENGQISPQFYQEQMLMNEQSEQ